ncbi:MAG TPA: AAA family ATPase, partial [Thermoguttaceae bacterium]|nr:AAA family ATPase [Thermoguttaceae bacterium]
SAPEFVSELVDWGAGPRAGQFLIQGGKALAAMDGRFSVAVEDVQKIAIPVLRHRISTNFQAQAEGMSNEDLIERLIRETPPPAIPKYQKGKG